MIDLVWHFFLFSAVVVAALAVPLIAGRLIRPDKPSPEKLATYECGEPTIGSSYIQFDLRFYVVALLFIVFDIEVAFFFPWASVYGLGTQLADGRLPPASVSAEGAAESARLTLSETLLSVPPGSLAPSEAISAETARLFAATGLVDVLVFFAVLLVGFAYVWKRGDLDWVRAVSERMKQSPAPRRDVLEESRGERIAERPAALSAGS